MKINQETNASTFLKYFFRALLGIFYFSLNHQIQCIIDLTRKKAFETVLLKVKRKIFMIKLFLNDF